MVSLQVPGEASVRPVPSPMGMGRGRGRLGGPVREKIQRAHGGGARGKAGKEKLGRGGVFRGFLPEAALRNNGPLSVFLFLDESSLIL